MTRRSARARFIGSSDDLRITKAPQQAPPVKPPEAPKQTSPPQGRGDEKDGRNG